MPTDRPDLPRPRDRDRLLDAINWLMGCDGNFTPPVPAPGNYWWRSVFRQHAKCFEYDTATGRYVWSIPPVSEASPEGMPELECPWAVVSRKDGSGWFNFPSRDTAEKKRRSTTDPENWLVVRLAVDEVAREPEPELDPEKAFAALGRLVAGLDALDTPGRVKCIVVDNTRPEVLAARRARLLEARRDD